MFFSHRKGLKKLKLNIQKDSLDVGSRNILWSILNIYYWENVKLFSSAGTFIGNRKYFLDDYINPKFTPLFKKLWIFYFREPIDTLSVVWEKFYNVLREYFFQCEWNEAYDFLEFLVRNYDEPEYNKAFIEHCNKIFETENIPYRFINFTITDVTDESEINEIEEAINLPFQPVSEHLQQALLKLYDKKNPDYRNSIKESISAIEALARIITKSEKSTLGEAIKILEKEYPFHSAFKSAIEKLYGYTSDANGIRHSLLEESTIEFEDAKFMLVACSTFVNYLKVKISKNKSVSL